MLAPYRFSSLAGLKSFVITKIIISLLGNKIILFLKANSINFKSMGLRCR